MNANSSDNNKNQTQNDSDYKKEILTQIASLSLRLVNPDSNQIEIKAKIAILHVKLKAYTSCHPSQTKAALT
jgi:hypothetical protein